MDWQAFGNVTVHILAGLTMLIGWLSLLIVIVPGLVIMWVGALGYGIRYDRLDRLCDHDGTNGGRQPY
jgi:uncharacterized protein YqgC (DUF456 family)